MRRALLSTALLLASGVTAQGAEPPKTSEASATLETHATSNALDEPLALGDIYTLLRGTISHRIAHPNGETVLALEAQSTSYRRYSIEDDRAVAANVEHKVRLANLELRGAIGLGYSSEGDDLLVGETPIGFRTDTRLASILGEVGIDLGAGFAAIGLVSARLERPTASRFEKAVLPETRIEPDADRLAATLSLRRTAPPFIQGVSVGLGRVDYEPLGDPPVSVSSRSVSARAELRYTPPGGATLGAGFGFERFTALNGLYDEILPVWELAALVPFGPTTELKASARAFFDTTDSDDALASYVRRGELEFGRRFGPIVTAGIGVFAEVRDNLLLENRQTIHGAYAEIGYKPSNRATILLRVDWKEEFASVFDTRTDTIDGFLRLAWTM